MPTVTVTLNKAQKLLDRLKTKCKTFGGPDSGFPHMAPRNDNSISVNYTHQGAADMEAELVAKTAEKRKYYEDYFDILTDVTNVHDALFFGNTQYGVSKVLNQIADQKKIKAVWEQLLGGTTTIKADAEYISAENLEDYYNLQCERQKTLAVSSFTVRREVFSKEELDRAIDECTRRINLLEDERDQLNHTNTVDIVLSNAGAKLLGM